MLSIDEAFRKFKKNLELNEKEQDNAAARNKEVRDFLGTKFNIDRDFLTGSYKRHTKTKPLKDVDIFFQLAASHLDYRKKPPSSILDDFHRVLSKEFGDKAVRKQARSINIDFGIVADVDDNTDYRVLSVDAVPAFAVGKNYEIPDTSSGKWILTNPEIHAEKATAAHKEYSNEWKGLVRMAKYWNNNKKHGTRPVKPSFLIEVMALQILHGGWQGRFEYEFQSLFSTMADRISNSWPDPAGLGPAVNNEMDEAAKQRARELLQAASKQTGIAIDHARRGRNGEALQVWRDLFGPKFPLS